MCANIKSIVAFDLEVTSLPQYDGFNTKIMEISFVACSVEHINQLTTNTLPRVLHKLTICCNPAKQIQISATRASSLHNFLLEKEMRFNENSGNLIKSYLERLQKPVCLIAHNGDRYDFPILAKELKMINVSLPEDLICVDSLRAFREIDGRNEKQIPNELHDKKDDSDNEDDPSRLQRLNESTPKRQLVSNEAQGAPSKKLCLRRLSYDTPERQLGAPSFISSSIKRTDNPNEFKKGYRLFQIYKRCYHKTPEVVHQAEADAINLLLCIIAAKNDFIPFMESDTRLFSEVKPLGY